MSKEKQQPVIKMALGENWDKLPVDPKTQTKLSELITDAEVKAACAAS